MSDTEIVVRYAETDQMGVVHHSVYPVWFEAARTDFMDKAGYPYPDIEKQGILLPLTRLECSYREGARYGDTVIITTEITKITPARIEISYKALRSNDSILLAEGKTVHAWTDSNMQIINLKRNRPDIYNLFEAALNKPESAP